MSNHEKQLFKQFYNKFNENKGLAAYYIQTASPFLALTNLTCPMLKNRGISIQ